MKKIHLNFAQNSHKTAQQMNRESALGIGGFDVSYNFNLNDIDSEFYEKNKKILDLPRGAGYWLWKPYFILKVLSEANYGDIIFYTDSGSQFIGSPDTLYSLFEKQDIIPFKVEGAIEIHNTKRDCFSLMDCDDKKYHYGTHLNAAFILLKKSDFSLKFIKEYLNYACDERCLTDQHSILLTEHPENRGHRHDQSIYSLMCKKYNLTEYRDPSQWGNSHNDYKEIYGQIISHTRFNG